MALSLLNRGLFRMLNQSTVTSRAFKLQSVAKFECNKTTGVAGFKRSLWQSAGFSNNKFGIMRQELKSVSCISGCRQVHTKGDQELVQFLSEEIEAEVKSQKHPKLPKIEGFDVKTDGASIVLTKNFNSEKITVKLNVNHTVDAAGGEQEASPTSNPSSNKPETTEMKSKPSFTVEIEKGGETIGFTCSYIQDYAADDADDPDAFSDIFNIDEVVFHKGEWKENTYSVSGEIIDGYLYDLLMNTLEERGISTDFAEKLSDLCTSYEHKLYITLLESLKSFVGSAK